MALNPLFLSGPLDPDGTPQVSPEPTTLLLDDYSQAVTTYHVTGGTAPSVSGGTATTGEGTVASATSYARSTLPYNLRAGTFLRVAHIVTVEASPTANNTRWWGYGQNQATPTAAAPVLNGAVWLLDSSASTAGTLVAAVFSNGTKTIVPWTTTPARDAAPHRYQVDYRQSVIYWSYDGVVVATLRFPQLAVATGMYEVWGAANTSTAPAAHTFLLSSSTVADLSAGNKAISDGANPGVMGTVKGASTAVAATDTAISVGLHPSSPLPAGTNTVGSVASIGTSVTPGTAAANLGKAEDAVAASGDAGVFVLAVRADTPSPASATTSTNGDYSQVSTDAAGQVWTKPGAPGASDPGLVPFRNAAVTAAVVVKASAGRIRRVRIYNPNTSVAFVQVLNTATSPAVGTNVVEEFVVPASSTYAENIDVPTTMSAGISVGATTTSGGTTVVTTGVNVQAWFV